MKTLIPLKDKIKELCSTTIVGGRRSRPAWILAEILKEIKFIDQKPELWMFVPCDKDGNVLEEPHNYHRFLKSDYEIVPHERWMIECREYQKAKERVLFKGFEFVEKRVDYQYDEVKFKNYTITFDKYGAYLQPYDSVDGERISTLEDLTHLGLELTDKAF